MWDMDYKESWVPENWCFWTVVSLNILERDVYLTVYKHSQLWAQWDTPKRGKNVLFFGKKCFMGQILSWNTIGSQNPHIDNICLVFSNPMLTFKWALGSINMNKASGGDGIPVDYFKSWKMILWKCRTLYCQQIWKTPQWPQEWKRSVFIPILKKGNAKECSNYRTIAVTSHTITVMLKILQARLQQYVNWELPDVQAGLRKGRGTRDQIANIHRIIRKAREFQKNILLLLWLPKAFDCVDHHKFKRWVYQTTRPASWEICMQVEK